MQVFHILRSTITLHYIINNLILLSNWLFIIFYLELELYFFDNWLFIAFLLFYLNCHKNLCLVFSFYYVAVRFVLLIHNYYFLFTILSVQIQYAFAFFLFLSIANSINYLPVYFPIVVSFIYKSFFYFTFCIISL